MSKDLQTRISEMTDEELQQLGEDYSSLTEEAQAFVRAEYARRSLEIPLLEEESPVYELQCVVTIRQFRDQAGAFLARSVLESAGISCFLCNENTVRMDWLWSNLMGGIRLQVAEEDVQAAEAVLSQPIPEHIDVPSEAEFEQPRCPRCESLDIGVQSANTKVGAASMLLLGFPLGSPTSKKFWLCQSCGNKWIDDSQDIA